METIRLKIPRTIVHLVKLKYIVLRDSFSSWILDSATESLYESVELYGVIEKDTFRHSRFTNKKSV